MKNDKIPLNKDQISELYYMGARFTLINKSSVITHGKTIDLLRAAFLSLQDDAEIDAHDLRNILLWFYTRENKAKNNPDLLWYLEFFAKIRFNLDFNIIFEKVKNNSWY